MKNITFSDKNVTITGRDANVLAGFAIVGIAVAAVNAATVCWKIGQKTGVVIYNLRHKNDK